MTQCDYIHIAAAWRTLYRGTVTNEAIASAIRHRYLSGRSIPLVGRLMMGVTTLGASVLLDPETGGELRAEALPAFIMSTEGEAGDGHILRQEWDLSRSADLGGVGIPVLWSHRASGELLGQWSDVGVRDTGNGRHLWGRANLDVATGHGAEAMGQIRRGFLRAVSVGWIPGEVTRRGALEPSDLLYLPPVDDECGQPAEGLVMGSAASPNRLLEASLCAVPSDPAAYVTERTYAAAERFLDGIGRATTSPRASMPADIDALLLLVRDHPGARAWISREIRAIASADRAVSPQPAPPVSRAFRDLLTNRG